MSSNMTLCDLGNMLFLIEMAGGGEAGGRGGRNVLLHFYMIELMNHFYVQKHIFR